MLRPIYAAVLINSEGKVVGMPIAAPTLKELEALIQEVFPGGVFTDTFGKKESGTVTSHQVLYKDTKKESKEEVRTHEKPRATSARKRLSAS